MAKAFKDYLTIAIVPILASIIIRVLYRTMRLRFIGYNPSRSTKSSDGQIMLAFWHGRLMMMPYVYPGRDFTVLISTHRDGELIARTVRALGIEAVRGSSTRGWVGGLKGLLGAVKKGRDLAITPDGPRGPRHKAQGGVIQIAAKTGLPIVPVAFGASKKKLLAAGTAS